MKTRLDRIEKAIAQIKRQLVGLKSMRPGSLTKQMRMAKEQYGSYWQLSYTHMGRGKTEYIRDISVAQVKAEVANYRRFRKLVDKIIMFSIEASRLKIKLGKTDPLK